MEPQAIRVGAVKGIDYAVLFVLAQQLEYLIVDAFAGIGGKAGVDPRRERGRGLREAQVPAGAKLLPRDALA